jgi:hypothetical protein
VPLSPPLLTLVAALAAALTPETGAASECARAVSGPGVATAPAAWGAAVERLLASTTEPGHPWSCAGGTVDLRFHGDAATLSVSVGGEPAVERAVTTPDDVVSLGQALLSLPREAPPPNAIVSSTTAAPAAPPPAPPTQPTLVLGGRVGPRLAGGADAAMVSAELSAAVPLDAWWPSLRLRYDTVVHNHRPPLDAFDLGLGFARVFALGAMDLRTGVTASAALLRREMPRPAGEQTRVDARLGAQVVAAVPLDTHLHLVAGLDFDLAQGRSRDEVTEDADGHAPTPFPFFTLGAFVGLELGL